VDSWHDLFSKLILLGITVASVSFFSTLCCPNVFPKPPDQTNNTLVCHAKFNFNFSTPILQLWVACWRALFSYLDNKSLLLGITVAAVAFFLFFFVAFLFISTVHTLNSLSTKVLIFPQKIIQFSSGN
jgi:hypothetical protein